MPEENSDQSRSEHFASEDPFEASVEEVSPLEGGTPSPAVPQTGNRPAEGARQATPGEVLAEHFQGSDAAGDFLGLDTEILSDLGVELEAPAELELAEAPATATEMAEAQEFHLEDDAGSLLQDPGTAPEYEDPDQDLDYEFDEEAEEFGEFEDFDEEEPVGTGSPLGRVFALTGAAFVVGLIAVGAVVYLPDYLGTDAPVVTPPTGGNNVARNTDPTPPATTTDPVGNPDGVTTPPLDPVSTGTGPVASGPEASDPMDPDPMISDPSPVEPGGAASTDPVSSDSTDPLSDPFTAVDLEDLGMEAAGDGETTAGGAARTASLAGPSALDSVLMNQLEGLPSDQLEMIWWGNVAPMEAAAAPVRILMPRVGNVRVIMTSDAVFDGKLFSMGQNQVEIDTNLGRMGLAGDRVARIEHLAGAPADAGTIVADVVRGDRVRVRTLGGILTGHVVSTKGKTVILQTQGGGQVTLHDPVLEPIGSSRAVVVEQ